MIKVLQIQIISSQIDLHVAEVVVLFKIVRREVIY